MMDKLMKLLGVSANAVEPEVYTYCETEEPCGNYQGTEYRCGGAYCSYNGCCDDI